MAPTPRSDDDEVRDLTDAELQRFGDPYRDGRGRWCSEGHLKLIDSTKWYLGEGNRPSLECLYAELRAASVGVNIVGRDTLRKILNRQRRPGPELLCALERAWPEVAPGDWSRGCPSTAFPEVPRLTVRKTISTAPADMAVSVNRNAAE